MIDAPHAGSRSEHRCVRRDPDSRWTARTARPGGGCRRCVVGGPWGANMSRATSRPRERTTVGHRRVRTRPGPTIAAACGSMVTSPCDPVKVGYLDVESGGSTCSTYPRRPNLAADGTIPYGLACDRRRRAVGVGLRGNRIYSVSAESGAVRLWDMPTTHSAPRRIELDARGPSGSEYANNTLTVFDPATSRFRAVSAARLRTHCRTWCGSMISAASLWSELRG